MSGFIEIIDTEMNTHLININRIEEVCKLTTVCKIFMINDNPALDTVCSFSTHESYASIKEKLRLASGLN